MMTAASPETTPRPTVAKSSAAAQSPKIRRPSLNQKTHAVGIAAPEANTLSTPRAQTRKITNNVNHRHPTARTSDTTSHSHVPVTAIPRNTAISVTAIIRSRRVNWNLHLVAARCADDCRELGASEDDCVFLIEERL